MPQIGRLAALLPLLVLGSACGAGEPAQYESRGAALVESAPSSAAPTAEVSPSESSTPEPKPKSYSGTGSKVIRVKATSTPGLISAVARGESNFSIYDIGEDGEERELLSNGIGNHRSTRMYNMDGETTVAFKVSAYGRWKITLKPLTAAREWTGPLVTGLGDDVLVLRPNSSGFQTIKSKCACDGNFSVTGYNDEAEESLLANEIGDSSAEDTLPDGTILVAVEGDGAWALERTGAS